MLVPLFFLNIEKKIAIKKSWEIFGSIKSKKYVVLSFCIFEKGSKVFGNFFVSKKAFLSLLKSLNRNEFKKKSQFLFFFKSLCIIFKESAVIMSSSPIVHTNSDFDIEIQFR